VTLSLALDLWPRKPSGTGGAPAVPENIVLTWDGNATDLTPLFAADSVTWEVNDYAEMRWSSSDATLATYTSEQRLITSKTPLTLASDFAYGSGLTAGTWYMQIWNYRGSAYVGKSNIETITLTSATSKFLLEGGTSRLLMEGGTSLFITEGS
jgi:hypothetical protein